MKKFLAACTVALSAPSLFFQQVFAHHEGSTPSPQEVLPAPTSDMTIFWVIGGVILGSILLIIILSYFTKTK